MLTSLPDRLLHSWETNAEAWTDAVRDGAIASRADGTDAAIVEAVLRGLPPGGRVLDVGCGEGWLCRALSALGVEPHGVDASAALVEAARASGGSFDHLLYEAAADDPERLGGPYDAAVFNFSLLSDASAGILRAVRDQLDPGGRVLIQTTHPLQATPPYADGWREESFAAIGDGFEPMPWYFRTFGSWVRLLRASGLVLDDVQEPTHAETGEPLSLILTASADAY